MPDVTISELPVASSVVGTDIVPISDGTTTKRASLTQVTGLVSGIPAGGIIMWSGAVANIPSGWALCNGANGTPNLTDRFVIGYSGTKPINSTGGSSTASGTTDSTTLTINQIPAHSHSGVVTGGSTNWSDGGLASFRAYSYLTTGSTSNTGGSQGHSHTLGSVGIIPPYYALAFIMKL